MARPLRIEFAGISLPVLGIRWKIWIPSHTTRLPRWLFTEGDVLTLTNVKLTLLILGLAPVKFYCLLSIS